MVSFFAGNGAEVKGAIAFTSDSEALYFCGVLRPPFLVVGFWEFGSSSKAFSL
jgi:hypothetical protein